MNTCELDPRIITRSDHVDSDAERRAVWSIRYARVPFEDKFPAIVKNAALLAAIVRRMRSGCNGANRKTNNKAGPTQ